MSVLSRLRLTPEQVRKMTGATAMRLAFKPKPKPRTPQTVPAWALTWLYTMPDGMMFTIETMMKQNKKIRPTAAVALSMAVRSGLATVDEGGHGGPGITVWHRTAKQIEFRQRPGRCMRAICALKEGETIGYTCAERTSKQAMINALKRAHELGLLIRGERVSKPTIYRRTAK